MFQLCFQSIKELESRIGKTEEFKSQDFLDVERALQVMTNENEENANPDENSPEFWEKQIPRKKKAMKTKMERLLIDLHAKDEILSKGKQYIDHLTRERERLREQLDEKEQVIEERISNLQIEVDDERNRRIATERELTEERNTLQQDRENLERERETYEQRIRESERTVNESELRLRELQSAVTAAQDALAEYRRLEPRDWIIRREEVILSGTSLGVGAWGKVYEGTFRGCQVAVKQIHDLILSPHNRRLFEREMSIASRCRHPHLLQFIGATNDDGSPLFVTELLDTDLRNVLTQRALHHEEIVCLALDIAKGLNYLHLNKPFPIMHRDISSSNVLLWRRGDSWRAKLSDYGAANFMRQCMTSNPGARIYAAPESLTSQQSPKVRTRLSFDFNLLTNESDNTTTFLAFLKKEEKERAKTLKLVASRQILFSKGKIIP